MTTAPTALLPPTAPAAARVRLLAVLMVALTAAFAASTVAPALRAGGTAIVWDAVVYPLVIALAAALCAARAVLVRRERRAWALLAAGLVTTAVGEASWSLSLGGAGDTGNLSIDDVLYLVFYPCAAVAVARLVQDRIPQRGAGMWFDGLISGLAVTSLAAVLAFDQVTRHTELTALNAATILAYPIGDLLLVLLVAGVLGMSGGRMGGGWALLTAGLVLWGVSDVLYALHDALGTYHEGGVIDVGWPLGATLIGLSAWARPGRVGARTGDWSALAVPSAAMLVAAGVLTVCAAQSAHPLAVALAAAAIVCAVGRMAVSFREVRALAGTRELALTDELTGLPNRRALHMRLQAAVTADAPLALLMIDFDRFKELNDTLGHQVGDQLLVEGGRLMKAALRPDDMLARLGGDEFAVVLAGSDDADAACRAARRIARVFADPLVLGGVPVVVEVSVGVALRPDHALSVAALLRVADVAMYQAKRHRSGVELYVADADAHSASRLALAAELRDAIGAGQLRVRLQPRADAATGVPAGAHAVLRWEHPEHGELGAGEFLPVVRQGGVVRALTDFVLAEALGVAAQARAKGRPIPVAVDITADDLLDPSLPNRVAAALARHGTAPDDLCLALTGAGIMNEPERAMAAIDAVHRVGVRLSIDAYGISRSSLARLDEMPLAELKIDRLYVRGMVEDRGNAAVVRAAAMLAHEVGLTVVADGVATDAVRRAARDAGCDVVQGRHVGVPMAPAAFGDWLARAPLAA